VSSRNEIKQLHAEADYYHDRVALLRAKLYRWASVARPAFKRSNERFGAHNSACAPHDYALSRETELLGWCERSASSAARQLAWVP
jgi:hypothetical protein